MSGTFSAGGLITGIDTNTLISQLVALRRQPLTRMETRLTTLNTQKTAINSLRTQLQTLRNRAQDFRLTSPLSEFKATSSDSDVATATAGGASPIAGAYVVNVTQLAGATTVNSGARMGGSIDPNVALVSSGTSTTVNAGTFTINGVQFAVDPATQSLSDVLGAINSSTAGVTATYDSATDKVTIANTAAGNTALINFGSTGDSSNFLIAIGVRSSTQSTDTNGSTSLASTANLGAVNPGTTLNNVDFGSGTLTSGTFSINGIAFTVDATTDALSDVIDRINKSEAQVTASYDATNDTLRLASKTLGSRTISLSSGTSNFLDVTNLTSATQVAGQDAQFTINGGAVQTRNTNDVSDAISGVTVSLLSVGSSTVTVSADTDAAIASVKSFLEQVNTTLQNINSLTANGGTLENDSSISTIGEYFKQILFSDISGMSGALSNLVDIGVSTGSSFDSKAVTQYQLDETKFLNALSTDPSGVGALFTNSDGTGLADQLNTYLEKISGTSGYLYERTRSSGIIDQQIEMYNDRISQAETRLSQYETRLRQSFTRMETLSAQYQQQSSSLSRISSGLSSV